MISTHHMRIMTVLSVFTFIAFIIFFSPVEGSESPQKQNVKLNMYGPGNDGNVSTLFPETEEDEIIGFRHPGNQSDQNVTMGTWTSTPNMYSTIIKGEILFEIWTQSINGSSHRIAYHMQLSVNGQGDSINITTNNGSMGTESIKFIGSIILGASSRNGDNSTNDSSPTQLHMNEGDHIEIRLICHFLDNKTNDTQGDEIVIQYGSIQHPSGITLSLDSIIIDYREDDIEVFDETYEIDPETITIPSKIYYLFGPGDIENISISASSREFQAKTHTYSILEQKEDHITIKWIWEYGTDKAPSGTYHINITVLDRSGNSWLESQILRFVTIGSPLDFFIANEDISLSPISLKANQTGYFNITLHCVDNANFKNLTPRIDIMITRPDGTFFNDSLTVSIDANSNISFRYVYIFDLPGSFLVTVEVNPKDDMAYSEGNSDNNADENNIANITVVIKDNKRVEADDENTSEEFIMYVLIGILALLFIALVILRYRQE